MKKLHQYTITNIWKPNSATGTKNYTSYSRNHEIIVKGKPVILSSSDPAFRGDSNRYNPEEMMVAALSSCHMLWYLHLCADAGVIVVAYEDQAIGTMEESTSGGGRFIEVVLYPKVKVTDVDIIEKAEALHKKAHELCFIANSVNFTVRCQSEVIVL